MPENGPQDVRLVLAGGSCREADGQGSVDLFGRHFAEAELAKTFQQGRVSCLRPLDVRCNVGRQSLVKEDELTVHAEAAFPCSQIVLDHRRREVRPLVASQIQRGVKRTSLDVPVKLAARHGRAEKATHLGHGYGSFQRPFSLVRCGHHSPSLSKPDIFPHPASAVAARCSNPLAVSIRPFSDLLMRPSRMKSASNISMLCRGSPICVAMTFRRTGPSPSRRIWRYRCSTASRPRESICSISHIRST